MRQPTRFVHLLILLSLLFGQLGALPAHAQSDEPPPTALSTGASVLADGSIVSPAAFDPSLDVPPAENNALIVDPNNSNWMVRYGSEIARRSIPARMAPVSLVPGGPEIPIGGWASNTVEAGARDIIDTAVSPDGRLWAAVEGDGLRVYGPNPSGVYVWTAIKAALGGLISNNVTAVAYFNGEIWVGTAGNGISILTLRSNAWRAVTAANSPLPNNTINRFTPVDVPNALDYIWVSTNGGAARYNLLVIGSSWTVLTTANGLPANDIFDVGVQFFGAQVFSYIATGSGVVRWNGTTLTPINGGGACQMDRATRILVESNFSAWFAAEDEVPALSQTGEPGPDGQAPDAPRASDWVPIGVCRSTISLGTFWSLFDAAFGLPSNLVTDMSKDGSGRVWFSFYQTNANGHGGLAAHDQGNWLILTRPASPLFNERVSTVLAAGEVVWAGHYDASVFSNYSPNWDALTPNEMGGSAAPRPLYLEQDRVWVGLGKVISWYTGAGWTARSTPSGHDITSFMRGSDDLLWFGTAGSGVYSFDSANGFVHETIANGLPSNDVRALFRDAEGNLWAATAGGLAFRGSSYWIAFTTANSGLASDDLTALAADGMERIWISTAANGISIYDPNANGGDPWSTQTTANGLPSNTINDLTTDPAGDIWAATAAGVAQRTNDSWTVHDTGDGLPSNTILSVTSDPAGLIWAATAAGLALRDASGWQVFRVTGSFLGADRIVDVAADGVRTWATAGNQLAVRGIVTGPIGNAPPTIASFAPTEAEPLATVTITGTNFDTRGPQYNEVRFCCFGGQGGVPGGPIAKVLSASSTQLVVEVPELAKSGKLQVTVHGLTRTSTNEFQIVPVITFVPSTCRAAGQTLTLIGRGFFGVGSAGAYVKIGNGQERLVDYQEPNKIIQYIRPGDTSGPVRVRLLNDNFDISANQVTIAELQVTGTSTQQAIEGQQMIWGKRTLVQVFLKHNGPESCDVSIEKGRLHWKKKDGTTSLASGRAYFPTSNGLKVGTTAVFPDVESLNDSVSFVAEYNTPRSGYSDPFSLSSFDGVRVTLGETWATALTVDIPANKFNYTTIGDQRHILNVPIVPSGFTAEQWDKYRTNLRDGMKHVARVYPQQDTEIGPYPRNWIHNYGGWPIVAPWPVYLDDDSDDYEDDWDDLRDQVDDIREDFNDQECNGQPCYPYFDQAMGVVAEELYVDGPTGKAISWCWGSAYECDRWSGISFIRYDELTATWLQEAIHATEWVDEDAINHDDDNEAHSRYDEGEPASPASDNCDEDLTFRQALIDQTGWMRRTVRLDDGAPYAYPMTACGTYLNMPKSALSYGPQGLDDNTFIEPIDQTHVVNYVKGNGLQTQETGAGQTMRTLRFNGSIDEQDHVEVTMSAILSSESAVLTPAGGNYHLLLRGSDDVVLLDHAFGVGGPHTHETVPQHPEGGRFNLRLPFPEGTVKVEVRHDGALLWSDTISAHAPLVNFTAPNGGSYNAANSIPVSWQASDQDGDAIKFNLDYSPDNGGLWIPAAQKLTGTSFDWNPNFVPASAAGRLRLRASDGFNTGSAVSAPFNLAARPPDALILTPKQDQVFTEGALLELEGGSFTAGGEDLGSFEWKHGNTVVGTDRGISIVLDQVGSQTYSLKVTADGQSDTTSVTILVLPDFDHDGMPNDWELTYQFNPLDPDDAFNDPDGDGLNNLSERQYGTHPRQADTDGDGASDGAEVNAHTNPLDPDKKPAAGPVLQTGASAFGFTVPAGAPVSDQKSFWITNGGAGSLNWSANSDVPWLQLNPADGAAPTEMTVTALTAGMATGTSTGHITVQGAGASGSPDVITVTLKVEEALGVLKLYLPSILH